MSIASGYVGLDVVNSYADNFYQIAKRGGVARLLLGMAFYEGLTQKKLDAMRELHARLVTFKNNSGVYVTNGRKYHGKVYCFDQGNNTNVYVGSSNFSYSGLKSNIECTMYITEKEQKDRLIAFAENLFSPENSIEISRADILVPGKKSAVSKNLATLWSNIKKYDPTTINYAKMPSFEFPLSRIVAKEKSNLNTYFGKGRLNSSTGAVTPRPWYEIELIASHDLNSHDLYPHGDFMAYTDDGYIIPMRTQGANDKNIRSKGSLQIFGVWLKGKLETSGALNKYEPVTIDTLLEYGTDKLIFYKIRDKEYYLKF